VVQSPTVGDPTYRSIVVEFDNCRTAVVGDKEIAIGIKYQIHRSIEADRREKTLRAIGLNLEN
jgi:hypothetical protein